MKKPSLHSKRWPGLEEYWREYGHQFAWEDLIDYKEREDGFYVVLVWDYGDGSYGVADVASDGMGSWEMQNDSDEITAEQWGKLYIVPECDWWRIRGEEG